MRIEIEGALLRRPEPRDVAALVKHKNDPGTVAALGGFSYGYSERDIAEWIEFHRTARNEVVWVIADNRTDECLGHIGLYNVDNRVRKAEYAILIGQESTARGLGTRSSRAVLNYGFKELNLNRIELSVLTTNTRAVRLYERLGFRNEGLQRAAQFRNGQYVDVALYAMLAGELPA